MVGRGRELLLLSGIGPAEELRATCRFLFVYSDMNVSPQRVEPAYRIHLRENLERCRRSSRASVSLPMCFPDPITRKQLSLTA